MINRFFSLLLLLLLLTNIPKISGQTSKSDSFNFEPIQHTGKDSLYQFQIRPVLQTQFKASLSSGASISEIEPTFNIRRMRFYFYGFLFDPSVQYKFQLRFESDNQTLYDAALKWHPAPGLEFWFGQENLPAARSQLISLKYLQFVERSLVHSVFDLQKDIGIWSKYTFNLDDMLFKVAGTLSNGEGIFRPVETQGMAYTGRVDFLPFGSFVKGGDVKSSDIRREKQPKLAIGTAYSYNDEANATRAQQGIVFPDQITTDIGTLYLDALFKYRGFSFMSEWIRRTAEKPVITSDIVVFQGHGFSIQSGYVFPNNWEIAVRYAGIRASNEIEAFRSEQDDYTIGLNKYVMDYHFKFQTDITYQNIFGAESDERFLYRLQVQLYF